MDLGEMELVDAAFSTLKDFEGAVSQGRGSAAFSRFAGVFFLF